MEIMNMWKMFLGRIKKHMSMSSPMCSADCPGPPRTASAEELNTTSLFWSHRCTSVHLSSFASRLCSTARVAWSSSAATARGSSSRLCSSSRTAWSSRGKEAAKGSSGPFSTAATARQFRSVRAAWSSRGRAFHGSVREVAILKGLSCSTSAWAKMATGYIYIKLRRYLCFRGAPCPSRGATRSLA